MNKMLQKYCLALLTLLVCSVKGFAAPGDTTVVHAYVNQEIVTDGSGSNKYYHWGEFPAASMNYSKVIMYLTFQCPDVMECAEWDYLDPISIARPAGVNSTPINWEFARFITPYGNSWQGVAGDNFKHGWYYDVTDFSTLLHDSVEIEYNHTGYETNTRGWKINIYFYCIEGTPARDIKNISRIYQGGFGYNSNIETTGGLTAQSVTFGPNTNEARVKIIQSGHGFDTENCSEFCPKNRYLKYDGTQVNQRLMWRECGFNSLFPQGGTWLYDRGNWCPGASVKYDDIEFHTVTPSTTHTFDIDMEAVGAGGYGTQAITAYVIEYGTPNFTTDVSLEAIISPSNEYESSRMNPICGEPVIVIRNNGTAPLTSLNVVYGVPGGVQSTYQWTGNLPFLGIDTVRITQAVNWSPNSNVFQVSLQSPNGTTDQEPTNNYGAGSFTTPPVILTNSFYVDFKSNNAPTENHYRIMDITDGTLTLEKPTFSIPNHNYYDTVQLVSGHCYSFEFYDDGPTPVSNPLPNDGLNWWANTADGAGYVMLRRTSNGVPVKTFGADFGTKFIYQFTCQFPLAVTETENQEISMIVSPNPSTTGNFNVSYTLPEKGAMLEVYNMVGMKVSSERLNETSGQTTVSLDQLPKGLYIIKVVTPGNLVHSERVISR
jgi:hypothetical protein